MSPQPAHIRRCTRELVSWTSKLRASSAALRCLRRPPAHSLCAAGLQYNAPACNAMPQTTTCPLPVCCRAAVQCPCLQCNVSDDHLPTPSVLPGCSKMPPLAFKLDRQCNGLVRPLMLEIMRQMRKHGYSHSSSLPSDASTSRSNSSSLSDSPCSPPISCSPPSSSLPLPLPPSSASSSSLLPLPPACSSCSSSLPLLPWVPLPRRMARTSSLSELSAPAVASSASKSGSSSDAPPSSRSLQHAVK